MATVVNAIYTINQYDLSELIVFVDMRRAVNDDSSYVEFSIGTRVHKESLPVSGNLVTGRFAVGAIGRTFKDLNISFDSVKFYSTANSINGYEIGMQSVTVAVASAQYGLDDSFECTINRTIKASSNRSITLKFIFGASQYEFEWKINGSTVDRIAGFSTVVGQTSWEKVYKPFGVAITSIKSDTFGILQPSSKPYVVPYAPVLALNDLTLEWDELLGANNYEVYRNGVKIADVK